MTGKRDWYDVAPKKHDDDRVDKLEIGLKVKNYHDPLNVMKKYLKETEKLQAANQVARPTLSSYKPIFPCVSLPQPREERVVHKHKKSKKKSSKSKKHKKEKSKKRSRSPIESPKSDEKIQKLLRLRAERLKREEIEKNRTKLLLAQYNPSTVDVKHPTERREPSLAPTIIEPVKVKQKYNCQFNPEIAKQNYEDQRRY